MPNLENLETKWLEVEASDGAGNVSVASWIEVMIIPAGRVLQNGQPVELDQLKIYQLDPTTKIYRVWDQAEYWPVSTEKSNLLNFILPAGTYYIESVPKTGNSKAKNRVVSQKISFEKSSNLLASDWELGESRSWLGWFGMRRLVPINIELDESKTGDMPSPISEREKWIGKKSVVFLGLADLPWYDQELYQAKVWAESEHAQLVISKVDIRIENGLLSKTYLIDSKGDTIDYKEGNWKR